MYKEKEHITGRHQIILLAMRELRASGKMLNWKTRCKTISVLSWEYTHICSYIYVQTLLPVIWTLCISTMEAVEDEIHILTYYYLQKDKAIFSANDGKLFKIMEVH